MKLTNQKKLASELLKCSPDRIWIDPERGADVKEAVTRRDLLSLLSDGLIKKKQKDGQSKVRSRIRKVQRRKGRQRGQGSRKGKFTARAGKKIVWINKVRSQRELLKELKDKNKLVSGGYRELYGKVKGGFFRSVRHIKLYVKERNLLNPNNKI